MNNMVKDPATMAAVDLLAQPFQNGIDGLMTYLWNTPGAIQWGSQMDIDYSLRKQDAVLLITGKSWNEWLTLTTR